MLSVVLSRYHLSSCDREHMSCKAESIYYLALYRNSLLTPAPDLAKYRAHQFFRHWLIWCLEPSLAENHCFTSISSKENKLCFLYFMASGWGLFQDLPEPLDPFMLYLKHEIYSSQERSIHRETWKESHREHQRKRLWHTGSVSEALLLSASFQNHVMWPFPKLHSIFITVKCLLWLLRELLS